ncbi:hypothetical protein BofuT4_uP142140.1 [Botrytis cinerea T4]|uniref:Uncharacterized protein n=1 Tax=Botryotinia fuckeliana (strain T4) TaxID=999810 RepID=G2YZA4_BOTF4|nr:hypothetical protein BofuT4_uP142140.1 [Botrytis cinerea T4]
MTILTAFWPVFSYFCVLNGFYANYFYEDHEITSK